MVWFLKIGLLDRAFKPTVLAQLFDDGTRVVFIICHNGDTGFWSEDAMELMQKACIDNAKFGMSAFWPRVWEVDIYLIYRCFWDIFLRDE